MDLLSKMWEHGELKRVLELADPQGANCIWKTKDSCWPFFQLSQMLPLGIPAQSPSAQLSSLLSSRHSFGKYTLVVMTPHIALKLLFSIVIYDPNLHWSLLEVHFTGGILSASEDLWGLSGTKQQAGVRQKSRVLVMRSTFILKQHCRKRRTLRQSIIF